MLKILFMFRTVESQVQYFVDLEDPQNDYKLFFSSGCFRVTLVYITLLPEGPGWPVIKISPRIPTRHEQDIDPYMRKKFLRVTVPFEKPIF